MRKFIQKGAQVIFIITNDGWWKKLVVINNIVCMLN